jgi:hypothetical protein
VTEALGLYNKDPERDDSKVVDYLEFCIQRALPGSFPPLPLTTAKLTRFMFFIVRYRKISNGWKGALTWRRAIVRWLAPMQIDPFYGVDAAVETLVHNSFANTVLQRRYVKVPMTMELFTAIWQLLGTGSELFELERTLFLLYQVGGYRAATFTLSTDKRAWARLVRLMHVSFFTAADGTRAAFIVLPETKTTASWRPVGHVLRANPSGDRSRCAVHRLEALVVARLAAGADPTEPIFINPNNNRPYSRNVFVSHLKVYIDAVASRFILGRRLPRPASKYVSAISFRRGVLSRLAGANVPAQEIAVFADHAHIDSQLAYICETWEAPGVTAEHLYRGM